MSEDLYTYSGYSDPKCFDVATELAKEVLKCAAKAGADCNHVSVSVIDNWLPSGEVELVHVTITIALPRSGVVAALVRTGVIEPEDKLLEDMGVRYAGIELE